MDREFFIKKIAQASMDLYNEYKILPSLTIAQACKESRFGTCSLSPHFNFFGMKWTKTCGCEYVEFSTKEQDKETGKLYTIKAKFRKYKSFEDGIRGYYNFITGYKRYHNLIGETDSYTACKKIHADGWATSKTYGESLYNDYIVPLGLEKYDRIVLGTSKDEDYIKKPKYNSYTVKKGDTLWGIALKFYGSGIKWRKIYDYNKLKTTVIKVGQSLKIPKGV